MDTATDERGDLDVDIDAELPCAVEGCENLAAWVASNVPCRHVGIPNCTPHKEYDINLLRRLLAQGWTTACTVCEGRVDRIVWIPL